MPSAKAAAPSAPASSRRSSSSATSRGGVAARSVASLSGADRPVAQLAERRSPKPQVGGSRPSWPASPRCGAGAQRTSSSTGHGNKGRDKPTIVDTVEARCSRSSSCSAGSSATTTSPTRRSLLRALGVLVALGVCGAGRRASVRCRASSSGSSSRARGSRSARSSGRRARRRCRRRSSCSCSR